MEGNGVYGLIPSPDQNGVWECQHYKGCGLAHRLLVNNCSVKLIFLSPPPLSLHVEERMVSFQTFYFSPLAIMVVRANID